MQVKPFVGLRSSASASTRRALERAITHDELVLQYQPVVALRSGVHVGLEALVRWDHPRHGRLRPSHFIPFAEDNGLIVDVGRWVVNRVCAQIAEWRWAGGGTVPVGVNLSANELSEPRFVEHVVDCLDAHELAPSAIAFEVTESVIMRNDATTVGQMRRLRDLGVHIAVDDFGVGYCSLNYLRQFEFSVLKIDRSFVGGIGSSDTDRAIIRTILSLAADLEMSVVAEGVETKAQAEYLHSVGCQFAQGFYISEPVDAPLLAPFATTIATA